MEIETDRAHERSGDMGKSIIGEPLDKGSVFIKLGPE